MGETVMYKVYFTCTCRYECKYMYTVYLPILQANVEFISKTVNEMSPSALLAIKVLKNIINR